MSQGKVYNILKKHGKKWVKTKEVSPQTSLADSSLKSNLNRLYKGNFIERKMGKNGVYYWRAR